MAALKKNWILSKKCMIVQVIFKTYLFNTSTNKKYHPYGFIHFHLLSYWTEVVNSKSENLHEGKQWLMLTFDDHWKSFDHSKICIQTDMVIAENMKVPRTLKFHVFGNTHDLFLCVIGSGMRHLMKIPLSQGSALISKYIHDSSYDIAHGWFQMCSSVQKIIFSR